MHNLPLLGMPVFQSKVDDVEGKIRLLIDPALRRMLEPVRLHL